MAALNSSRRSSGSLSRRFCCSSGKASSPVTAFAATGSEEENFARAQVAFYASTPSYRPVMDLHGWGDTAEKLAYFDKELLRNLGVEVNAHGKMPDVVVYHSEKGWLVLIEAVTSHGPVDAKRRGELEALFKGCKAELVYVTAFLTRRAMVKYLDDISWETEVWVAESPSHLIHFNGERFLGPEK